MHIHQEYNELIQKLDAFIRKYYKNQMIRGSMYSVALILGTYLFVILLEYFGRFNIPVRTALFWFFVTSATYVLGRFFVIPLLHLARIGKIISHTQAAEIVGRHFPEVQDKLLNVLQLQSLVEAGEDNSLIEASIRQKANQLRPVPFSSAVDFRENRKYIKWVLPPVSVFLILLFAAPSILTKPTDRLIRHGQLIAEEAPFRIDLINADDLHAIEENTDVTLHVELTGDQIPEKVYLLLGGQQFLLQKESAVSFTYTLKNVTSDAAFGFEAGGFFSDQYELNVLPSPKLIDFVAELHYPSYLGRQDETIRNTGDLVVPQGTEINWTFTTKNAESLTMVTDQGPMVLEIDDDEATYAMRAMNSFGYSITQASSKVAVGDSMHYQMQVVPDLNPSITLQVERDSTTFYWLFFSGDLHDDYGFSRLQFNYQISSHADGRPGDPMVSVDMPVAKNQVSDAYSHAWDLSALGIQPGDKLVYSFTIWDNDGVNGSKSATTGMREYAVPTEDELNEQIDQQNDQIKEKLEESIQDAKALEKQLEELRRQLLEKKEMSWQDKKKLEELLKKQEELKKQVEDIRQQNEMKNEQQQQLDQQSEELREKQKQLEELMQQVMTPELEKLMEELRQMMEQLNKDQIQKELEKMDLSNEDMEKELDRALEQFKQLEFEQKMEKTIDKLEKLAEEQEKLANESENKNKSSEELKQKQDELNKEFDDLKKEMDELEKMNQELENPNEMPNTDSEEQEIDQEQQKSSDELQKNKKGSASKSQKSAAKKMQEMANEMQMSMSSQQQEQQEEDMGMLRALLENIVTLSFDQEALMGEFGKINSSDPIFNKLGQRQRKLKDDAAMVEDSLFALSKRVPQISAAVNHEINLINEHMQRAIEGMPDRKTGEITMHQQYTMTSFNNLALMLDEALQQMQQQQSQNKPGSGSCNKPGGKGNKPKPSASQLKQMQQSLSKQLEEMKKQGKNQGQTPGQSGELSKQLAEMAAKQAAIRKAVEEKANELNEDGSGSGNELKQIAKEMEELQKDIVNNQIDEETLRRQKDLEIRLLKAEEAERTQDRDNERKSNESLNAPRSTPPKYEEYLRKKSQEAELLKTVPPSLKPYYREKVNSYFNKLGSE